MNYKYKLITAFCAGAALLSSCAKMIEVKPRQSIESATALNSRENINAAIVGAYTPLKSARLYGRDLIAIPEALADNGIATNKSGRFVNEAANVFNAHMLNWQASYTAIANINLVLDAIPKLNLVPAITETERADWVGQLYFLRALYLFDIAKTYAYVPGAVVAAQDRGGVPVITAPIITLEDAINFLPSRAPIAAVYTQIYKDLDSASARLLNGGSNFPYIASKVAAQLLYSRVALYNKDYTNAKRWADSVITTHGSRLTDTISYVSGWRQQTNPESLFEVRFANNSENIGVNESLQTSFTTLVVVGDRNRTGGFGDLVPSASLLSALGITYTGNNGSANANVTARTADVRNRLYEGGTAGRGAAYIECTKYFGKNGSLNLDNVPVLRVAEAYLNRAEALSTTGSPVFNEAAAILDLNKIRVARGLPSIVLGGDLLYSEVLLQRRLEFAYEGHRFYDLKRLGRDITKGTTTLFFTDGRILPAIPQREIDGNKNLVQNFGY